MTPEGIGLIEYIARGGSADGATTDAAGYAIGSTVITLAAAGGGRIVDGQVVMFQGDDRGYRVQTGLADVSGGGQITLASPLRQEIPAAQTAIWTGNELKRGFGHFGWQQPSGYLPGNTSPFWADWYNAGDVAQIWLDYRYEKLDHKHKDFRSESVSTAKVVEIQSFPSQERYIIGQDMVTDKRGPGLVSDMSAIEMFVDTAMNGDAFIWFPDYENYPDEYLSCILNKRAEPQRVRKYGLYKFDFDVRVLPLIQMPSSIPGFI